MELLILVLVIIGALFVIASGIWVAIVLARVVSKRHVSRASPRVRSGQACPRFEGEPGGPRGAAPRA